MATDEEQYGAQPNQLTIMREGDRYVVSDKDTDETKWGTLSAITAGIGIATDEHDGLMTQDQVAKLTAAVTQKTVVSTTNPVPDFIGQPGVDSNGQKYRAIATTGTMWEPLAKVDNSTIAAAADGTLSLKDAGTTPAKLANQTVTVVSVTNPTPSYIGQPGVDASGKKYRAIALTGTMWEVVAKADEATITAAMDGTLSLRGGGVTPAKLAAQLVTVTSLTAPTPVYLGQLGEDSLKQKYIAVALTGTCWEKIENSVLQALSFHTTTQGQIQSAGIQDGSITEAKLAFQIGSGGGVETNVFENAFIDILDVNTISENGNGQITFDSSLFLDGGVLCVDEVNSANRTDISFYAPIKVNEIEKLSGNNLHLISDVVVSGALCGTNGLTLSAGDVEIQTGDLLMGLNSKVYTNNIESQGADNIAFDSGIDLGGNNIVAAGEVDAATIRANNLHTNGATGIRIWNDTHIDTDVYVGGIYYGGGFAASGVALDFYDDSKFHHGLYTDNLSSRGANGGFITVNGGLDLGTNSMSAQDGSIHSLSVGELYDDGHGQITVGTSILMDGGSLAVDSISATTTNGAINFYNNIITAGNMTAGGNVYVPSGDLAMGSGSYIYANYIYGRGGSNISLGNIEVDNIQKSHNASAINIASKVNMTEGIEVTGSALFHDQIITDAIESYGANSGFITVSGGLDLGEHELLAENAQIGSIYTNVLEDAGAGQISVMSNMILKNGSSLSTDEITFANNDHLTVNGDIHLQNHLYVGYINESSPLDGIDIYADPIRIHSIDGLCVDNITNIDHPSIKFGADIDLQLHTIYNASLSGIDEMALNSITTKWIMPRDPYPIFFDRDCDIVVGDSLRIDGKLTMEGHSSGDYDGNIDMCLHDIDNANLINVDFLHSSNNAAIEADSPFIFSQLATFDSVEVATIYADNVHASSLFGLTTYTEHEVQGQIISGNTTLTPTGNFYVATVGGITITLPDATLLQWRQINIKNISSQNITLAPNGTQQIDGSSTPTTIPPMGAKHLFDYNSEWYTL